MIFLKRHLTELAARSPGIYEVKDGSEKLNHHRLCDLGRGRVDIHRVLADRLHRSPIDFMPLPRVSASVPLVTRRRRDRGERLLRHFFLMSRTLKSIPEVLCIVPADTDLRIDTDLVGTGVHSLDTTVAHRPFLASFSKLESRADPRLQDSGHHGLPVKCK